MLQVGVVGVASFYGPRYANRAAERSDASVAGVVPGASDDALAALNQPTGEAFAAEHDCPVYDDVSDLAAAVDAVVVGSRLDRRADDAARALRAGCPVLTAKPAADGPEGGEQIAAAAAEAGLPAVTTAPMRFDDAVTHVAREVRDGTVGEVVRAEVHVQHDPVGAAGIDVHPESAPEQAGPAYTMGVYAADTLLWLVESAPERLYAEYVNATTPHLDHPDSGTATVRFADDTLGSMTLTYSTETSAWHQWEVEVVGTDGVLTTTRTGYAGYQWSGGDAGPEAFGRQVSPVLDRQFDAFAAAATGGDPPGPHPATVRDELAVCRGWERAAERGEPVAFE
jgi:predicted dehydrogenase